MHLPEVIARGIADAGFERCTPIQAQTLPLALAGLDVAGQAQTGTGKTAAFLVALYSTLLHATGRRRGAPTPRPRADRRADARAGGADPQATPRSSAQHTGLTLGARLRRRRLRQAARGSSTRGVDVLIGTPGRLIDFFKQHVFDLRSVQVLVLDEADRMFDLGFIADIRYILRRLPPPEDRRQSCCSRRRCRSACSSSPTST